MQCGPRNGKRGSQKSAPLLASAWESRDSGGLAATIAVVQPNSTLTSRSPNMSNAHILFWASVVLLGYTYLGSPVLMFAWASLRSRPPRPRDSEPPVTVLVVAHNESTRITTRLDNLLSLDYPSDKLEIMIGSDGSTDDTVERARAYEDAGVMVVAFPDRRGKSTVLNDLVPKARGGIVVLADARQHIETG